MACIPVYKGKRFPSTEKLIEYLSTEEGMMAHLADGKDTEFIKAIEGVIGATGKTTPTAAPSSLADQIADLRAKEQAEYDAMADPNDKAKRKEIYDRYDKPISDLLAEQEKEEGKQQTNDSKNKPRVSGEGRVGQESVQAESVEGGGATQTQAGGNVQGNEKKVSPFTAFDPPSESMSKEQGRKARAALKENVGPEEFKRMENIHRNGEKMLKELQAKGILEIRCP